MKLKIFLMTKNETALLQDWLKYHSYLFGPENIIAIDGSDDPRIEEIFSTYIAKGLIRYRSKTNLNGLAAELTEKMHLHKGPEDFLIKLDTDEFLAHVGQSQPEDYDAFEGQNPDRHLSVDGFDAVLDALPVSDHRYRTGFTTWSMPKSGTVSRPTTEITRFSPLQRTTVKAFYHSQSFIKTDLGCHNGLTKRRRGFINTGLTLIHYHSVSVEDSIRRAEQVLLSHGYIAREDSAETQIQKLSDVVSKRGVASSHKAHLVLSHLKAQTTGQTLDPGILNATHPYYREAPVRFDFSLVKDVLARLE